MTSNREDSSIEGTRPDNTSSKSLLANHFLTGSILRGYLKVISLRESYQNEERNSKGGDWPRYTCPVEIKEFRIKMDKTIFGVVDLEKQDVFQWIDDFRSLLVRCNWADPGAQKLLLRVVSAKYHPAIESCNTIDDGLKALCVLKYPVSKAMDLYQKLKSLKQDSYSLIDYFYKEIVVTVN
ncbi:hypothetical protein RF11_12896 [Thelohanellus kitauei]|uniref:Uncharacterized protein n=1 Tax=Thelohanellus kitauei TaxID=669202 RepID=A0A0C2M345_THEKT|nr:hypothetical protein RF11_12896 [Thelohanellus kitauei]